MAGSSSLAILYVAAHANPMSRTFVQAASGVIVGLFLQPSTSGIVALVTGALSLSALPRRSFIGGVALFALGAAAGVAAMILTSMTSARR